MLSGDSSQFPKNFLTQNKKDIQTLHHLSKKFQTTPNVHVYQNPLSVQIVFLHKVNHPLKNVDMHLPKHIHF